MLLDMFDQAILILAHLEEVIVFTEPFHWAFAVGAEATDDIFFSPESFVKRAIPPSIVSLINQFVVVKLLKVLLNNFFMLLIGRSDEGIVRDVEP